ncbi:MAG: TetR/AcrR family transcriptional regulator [Alphaproteobacteria bacterium]|jgi:TetR/AcrR family transcriptional repressor of lmrAB and yxaGH operons|nr:TetR/AcrR family transcriptional regulator [Alphaproteobacteria bacterium]MDP6254724.1 TetR/AcrR family transcriptional regulator [Alphaproteobacteria bacterium]MDP7052991.1 TetR/AcrR family transcriptional regulator [Alphaproteobacteria bacterium]MDP7231109.1 TetR/AcrR family transcriptional regulator [Alphaproteobacteria bacterium]MDP7462069.1 TetR/AcrR family transcriptional regulator [Alphaproteobacteria bacterium]|tara:strand:+ start:15129 stop:15731 length:603 start_codon:yes stop_codon:yes gene_type:complete
MALPGNNRKQRDNLIWAAAKLFRRQGYSSTGLRDILAASGAARGSLYHYFPDGKEQIGAAAVTAAGGLVTETFAELARQADNPTDFLRRYTDFLVRWLEASDFRDGCPITTTLLETAPGSGAITAAGQAVFADWRAVIEAMLRQHDWPAAQIAATATAIIAGLEGALLLARVEASAQPIHDATQVLCQLLEENKPRQVGA